MYLRGGRKEEVQERRDGERAAEDPTGNRDETIRDEALIRLITLVRVQSSTVEHSTERNSSCNALLLHTTLYTFSIRSPHILVQYNHNQTYAQNLIVTINEERL